jgi:hypothetical protein
MLSSGTKCYQLGQNVIIWDEMLLSGANVIILDAMLSNSCCLLNQNTAYVVTADHNYCHHFLFISVGVNCYTFTYYIYVQLTKGLRQLRKC